MHRQALDDARVATSVGLTSGIARGQTWRARTTGLRYRIEQVGASWVTAHLLASDHTLTRDIALFMATFERES